MELSEDELKRRALFVPCNSKEALHRWIRTYLGLDMPDTIVDPDSTSTPMDFIWEVYDKARRNDDPKFRRVLVYASRDSFKTLAASVLETLAIVHLGRSLAHMAAIEKQAEKAQSYVRDFFNKPFLREYVVGDNVRHKEFVRYYNPESGESIPLKLYARLTSHERLQYKEYKNYIAIVICTIAGANSEHVPFFVVDEVDVVPNVKAYEEAKMIPAPRDGLMPITVLTSTRKYSFGLVQKEIDEAPKSKLIIRHWNLIDVTEKCPTSRHAPEKPKQKVYVSKNKLLTILPDEHDKFTAEEQEKEWVEDEAYYGCVKNCQMFAMCRGRLATKQVDPRPGSLLKPVEHTQSMFGEVEIETAKAQLLCWKPSTEGLIYPNFDPDIHMLEPFEIAEMVTGEPANREMTKSELIALLKTREVKFWMGMDFGYTHNFACVLMAQDGNRGFILDVISQPEIELAQQIELCDARVRHYQPKVFADPESPQSIVTFRKAGYKMRKWSKMKGSVNGGIDVVRYKLRPGNGPPTLFFLKNDPGVDFLVKRISKYHWVVGQDGVPTDIPEDKNDDECDALRYVVMNVFAKRGELKVARGSDADEKDPAHLPAPADAQKTVHNFLRETIRENLGEAWDEASSTGVRKGGFFFDM